MLTRILAVGKLKEAYWQEAFQDYSRRLAAYTRLEVVEVPEQTIPKGASPAKEAKIMALEGEAILERIRGGSVVVLDRQGMALDSLELAQWLEERVLEGRGEITWVLGGPLGLDASVKAKADLLLSLSRLTFPHQMARLLLMEQIYRCFRIMRHEPYHR
jgi:23S rRNA (pseudouridine1915-N3)-methyltransferase